MLQPGRDATAWRSPFADPLRRSLSADPFRRSPSVDSLLPTSLRRGCLPTTPGVGGISLEDVVNNLRCWHVSSATVPATACSPSTLGVRRLLVLAASQQVRCRFAHKRLALGARLSAAPDPPTRAMATIARRRGPSLIDGVSVADGPAWRQLGHAVYEQPPRTVWLRMDDSPQKPSRGCGARAVATISSSECGVARG